MLFSVLRTLKTEGYTSGRCVGRSTKTSATQLAPSRRRTLPLRFVAYGIIDLSIYLFKELQREARTAWRAAAGRCPAHRLWQRWRSGAADRGRGAAATKHQHQAPDTRHRDTHPRQSKVVTRTHAAQPHGHMQKCK